MLGEAGAEQVFRFSRSEIGQISRSEKGQIDPEAMKTARYAGDPSCDDVPGGCGRPGRRRAASGLVLLAGVCSSRSAYGRANRGSPVRGPADRGGGAEAIGTRENVGPDHPDGSGRTDCAGMTPVGMGQAEPEEVASI